jgi:transposase
VDTTEEEILRLTVTPWERRSRRKGCRLPKLLRGRSSTVVENRKQLLEELAQKGNSTDVPKYLYISFEAKGAWGNRKRIR